MADAEAVARLEADLRAQIERAEYAEGFDADEHARLLARDVTRRRRAYEHCLSIRQRLGMNDLLRDLDPQRQD